MPGQSISASAESDSLIYADETKSPRAEIVTYCGPRLGELPVASYVHQHTPLVPPGFDVRESKYAKSQKLNSELEQAAQRPPTFANPLALTFNPMFPGVQMAPSHSGIDFQNEVPNQVMVIPSILAKLKFQEVKQKYFKLPEFKEIEKCPMAVKYKNEQDSVYVGGYKLQQRCGYGKQVYPDGSYYEGFWLQDNPHFFGIWVFAADRVYEGQFKQNRQHGEGSEYVGPTAEFHGHYQQGKKFGTGRLTLANGSTYTGEFQNDVYHGQGILTTAKGVYTGQFAHGKQQGYGEMKYNDGRKFRGLYCNARKHGKGEMTLQDQTILKGTWNQDVLEGLCVWIIPEGPARDCVFVDGKFSHYATRTEVAPQI